MQDFRIHTPQKAYKFLMQNLNIDINKAQRLINKGRVFYKGGALKNNEKARILSDFVSVLVFMPESKGLKPLFENENFAIFNKPEKLLIHPKGRFYHYTLLDEVRHFCGEAAALAHRIDSETSGLVLVGKNKDSIKELGELFLKGGIYKEYLALVGGILSVESLEKFSFVEILSKNKFLINLPLATQEKGGDLSVKSIVKGEVNNESLKFKEALSECEILGFLESKNTLLKVIPKTGRTHQIRAHLNAINHSILGDPLYGAKNEFSRIYLDSTFILDSKPCDLDNKKRIEYFKASRLMLHSYLLGFRYKGESYKFYSSKNFEINGFML